MRNALLLVLTLFGASLCFGAEVYPSKPVRVIVSYAPGGTSDIVGRVISQQLSEQLGKSFVVDNRAGASGTIGYGIVARAAPDGYTLTLVEMSFSMIPSLFKSPPFDVVKDFSPITQIIGTPLALVVHPSLKANTLKEFVALAQASPGKFNYGSAGVGTQNHLSAELFKTAAKVNIVHVPYKGGAGDVIIAMLSGQIEMLITPMPSVLPHVKSGKVRALAVTTDGKRALAMPDVPSISEAGVSGMTIYSWFGLAAPAGTPKEVVNKLRAEVVKALVVPSVKDRLIAQGGELVGSTPNEYSELIRSEMRRWAGVIKSAGITPE